MKEPLQQRPLETGFTPWSQWLRPVAESKVALVTTGGVYLKHGLHEPYALAQEGGDCSFREFPAVVATDDVTVGHGEIDLRHAEEDVNVIFPLDRLRELADAACIGSVAPFAYSFTGPIADRLPLLADFAPSVAYRIRRMGADLALIIATGRGDHETAALVARAIELAGVPTLVLGIHPEPLQRIKAPRAVVVQHPEGAPLGRPGDVDGQQQVLRSALEAAWRLEGPGLVEELPFTWQG